MRSLRFLHATCRPFLRSPDSARVRLLLAFAVALTLGLIWLNVVLNDWNAAFYNALQARDGGEFRRQLGRYALLLLLLVAASVQRSYIIQAVQIRWRRWHTEELARAWLKSPASREAEGAAGVDNPDQRISEDVRLFTTQTLDLAFQLLSTLLNLIAFLAILWRLSAGIAVAGVRVPGLMIWTSMLYAAAGAFVTHRVGRRLVGLNFVSQSAEADFRFDLARARLEDLPRRDAEPFVGALARAVAVSWQLARRQKLLSFVTSGYGQFTIVFPYLILAPQYFAGGMDLGTLVQAASAFLQVHGGLSWPISSYPALTAWRATADRLHGLHDAVGGAPASPD